MYAKILNLSVAVMGSGTSYLYGGMSAMLEFLLLLVVVDYVTGIVASIKEARAGMSTKGLSSKRGSIGLAKKGIMFLIIAVMHRADVILDMNVLMAGAIWFYVSNELISVTENLGRLDMKLIPPQLKEVIAVLKNKDGDRHEAER
ncbi:phage holin family protein [Paenibacillus tuaregi]|uniref:phage holin family protein n=1 Tax=Paenibacillus tuaregi TaxID=1816681 RepID=UPI000A9B64C8|nr:phage holin family protein [Paenibacillus tuaregi]